ncbi:MAG: valine--tRNA ligase, partial [Candidatus Moraniibacteriota bacterium]
HDTIVNQCKKMGSSLDWSREAYTLDEKRNFAVRTAFKKMYDDGIIYRGERIVNWDPKMQTTVSDDEIEWETETAPLYYFQYGPFVISTARPETKFGDKYVVMHPDDERYQEYTHGQKIELEWISGKITATVIKDSAIDKEFGTGVMTITPWHDNTDFEIALRHNLDKEQIIDENGFLLPIAGELAGLPIKEARKKIVEKLEKKNLIVKVEENYSHNIATNSRGGGIIEPQIKKQWWINVNKEFERDGKTITLKSLMQDAVRSKKVTILPSRFDKIYFHWIDNLRDWCISRQIWFGHRIPVWYRDAEVYCGIDAPEGDGWEQDPDTLDTWFSSGLWTFSTLGWPDVEAKDFKVYHPTNLLETGYDIIFFWVARMILMSEYLLGVHPFDTVYLHGLVRDEHGRKMSKSLGNVMDPLIISEQYGADALRVALVSGSAPGNDLKLSDEKILAMRNFTNKIWNLARYVGTQTETAEHPKNIPTLKTPADHWIFEKLQTIVASVTHHLDSYELSLAAEELRDFTWGDLADWYVEIHKVEKNDEVLRFVLDTTLKLWHPFMPFVTEAIHQTFHFEESEFLMIAPWPKFEANEKKNENSFELIKDLIVAIRNARATYHIEPVKKMTVSVHSATEKIIRENEEIFKRLARVDNIHTTTDVSENAILIQAGSLQVLLHLEGIIDTIKERARFEKEKTEKMLYVTTLESKLGNQNFIDRAKPEVILTERIKLETTQKELSEIEEHLSSLDK